MTKYKVTITDNPEWVVVCGGLSPLGVEKMKGRISQQTGHVTVWAECDGGNGYWVTPATLLRLLNDEPVLLTPSTN